MEATSEQRTKDCPACGQDILVKALKCRHCGAWMPDLLAPAVTGTGEREATASVGDDAPGVTFSNAQPVRHLVLLSVVTFGLYEFLWFYRNWRDVTVRTGLPAVAGWRTAGLLVPFLNIFLVYQQLRLIRDVVGEAGVEIPFTPGTLTAIFFLTAAIANVSTIWIVSLFTIVPLIPVQECLNRYWELQQPDASIREELTPAEFAMAVVGAFLTVIAVAGTLTA